MNRIFLPAMVGALLVSAASGWAQNSNSPYGVGLNGLGGTHASPMTSSGPTRTTTDSLNAINPTAGPSSSASSGAPLSDLPNMTPSRGSSSTNSVSTMPRLTDFPNGR